MQVLFSVVRFAPQSARLAVVGSSPALGSWDTSKAACLTPQQTGPISEYVSTCFAAVLEIPELLIDSSGRLTLTKDISYKFITWQDHSASAQETAGHDNRFTLPAKPETNALTADGNLFKEEDFHLRIRSDKVLTPPSKQTDISWEGEGSQDNRLFTSLATSTPSTLAHFIRADYMLSGVIQGTQGPVYLLPPANYLEPRVEAHGREEFTLTTRYYNTVKAERKMHFNQVTKRIYCGSCPRRLEHLDLLKDEYNVGIVFNMQDDGDVARNWIDDDKYPNSEMRNSAELQKVYSRKGMLLVHIPTLDMCSEARAAMMAQSATLVAAALTANPDRSIYIHCNAGVGRAVACTCSFLRFCIGLEEAHVPHLLRLTRTVGYVDLPAMRLAHDDFKAKFAPFLRYLPLMD